MWFRNCSCGVCVWFFWGGGGGGWCSCVCACAVLSLSLSLLPPCGPIYFISRMDYSSVSWKRIVLFFLTWILQFSEMKFNKTPPSILNLALIVLGSWSVQFLLIASSLSFFFSWIFISRSTRIKDMISNYCSYNTHFKIAEQFIYRVQYGSTR